MASTLFYTFLMKAVEAGGTNGSEYLERINKSDTTNGWTAQNVKHSKFSLATGATKDITPADWGTPVTGNWQVVIWIEYNSGVALASQVVAINKDANGAENTQWIFADSFATSLTINNATGQACTVEYIIIDRSA